MLRQSLRMTLLIALEWYQDKEEGQCLTDKHQHCHWYSDWHLHYLNAPVFYAKVSYLPTQDNGRQVCKMYKNIPVPFGSTGTKNLEALYSKVLEHSLLQAACRTSFENLRAWHTSELHCTRHIHKKGKFALLWKFKEDQVVLFCMYAKQHHLIRLEP